MSKKAKHFNINGESIDVAVDWENVENPPTIPSGASQISTDEGISDGKNVQDDLTQLALEIRNTNKNTNEDGFYICDENGNVLIRLDELDSKGGFGENLKKEILNITSNEVSTIEDGYSIINEKGEIIVKYIDNEWLTPTNDKNGFVKKEGDMPNGITWFLTYNSVKNDKRYLFSADIDSFSSVTIGHGKITNYGGSWIVIDSTNVYVHNAYNSDSVVTKAHGLTSFTKNIQVEIIISKDRTAKIRLTADGVLSTDVYDNAFVWSGCGAIYVTSNSELKNCVASWCCNELPRSIWMFGDSYFSLNDEKRWTTYLIKDGYSGFVLNAHGGEATPEAITEYKYLRNMAKPDKILWCMGMNDVDVDESTPNADWLEGIEYMIKECQDKGIELILATIPSAPGTSEATEDSGIIGARLNKAKSDYVRARGLRYIDFDKALQSNSEGQWGQTDWCDDGCHPTEKGAMILYHRAICDMPELTR